MNNPIVHPPSKPIANARLFMRIAHTPDDKGRPHLVCHRDTFRVWDGRAWPQRDHNDMKASLYAFFEHAMFESYENGKSKMKYFNPDTRKVNNLIEALKAAAHIDSSLDLPCWLDRPDLPARDFIVVENGVMHIPTGALMRPTPDLLTPYSVNYPYLPDAPPPAHWLAFLDELWGEDPQMIDTLQEVFGYMLVPDTSLQKIVLLVGPKRSGKGTIARVLQGLVGPHNVAGPTLSSLGTNFGLQPLIDRSVAIFSDARLSPRNGAAVTERLLAISGEDALTIDRKYRTPWTGSLATRLVFLTNELPQLDDASGALASRFLVFRTSRSFYGVEDPNLTDTLLSERSAILAWARPGLNRLRERGHFVQPASAAPIIADLEALASPVGAFVNDDCLVGPEYTVDAPVLYEAWRRWCDRNGHERSTAQTFGRDLRAVLPDIQTTQRRIGPGDERVRVYVGVTIAG